jgi:NAD(P)-dependent dehydrogenase (short-subunit alcohol dehydrogenase family)
MGEASRSITDTLGHIDLAVFNAGIWEAMSARNFLGRQGRPFHGRQLSRQPPLLAIGASVPTAAYGPGKPAVINLAETPNNNLAMRGIKVSVINPGYVDAR